MTHLIGSNRPAARLPANGPEVLALARTLLGFDVTPGMLLEMTCECEGADDEDETVTAPAGSLGEIVDVEDFGERQGLAITVVIRENPALDPMSDEARSFTNAFDEADTRDRFPFRIAPPELAARAWRPAPPPAADGPKVWAVPCARGPWQAAWTHRRDVGQEQGWHVYGPDMDTHGVIANLSDHQNFRTPAEVAAHAHVMAAAPELLAALEGLSAWAREHTSPRDANTPHELLVAAQAAIGKAREIKL